MTESSSPDGSPGDQAVHRMDSCSLGVTTPPTATEGEPRRWQRPFAVHSPQG